MSIFLRYYQAGIVNAAFGYGCYALLVWAGLNIYAAQLVAHVLGVAFNYVTYSRHVFRDTAPAKLRFALSYAVNYFVGLGLLAFIAQFVTSPYLVGLLAIIAISLVNFFALRHLVFAGKPA